MIWNGIGQPSRRLSLNFRKQSFATFICQMRNDVIIPRNRQKLTALVRCRPREGRLSLNTLRDDQWLVIKSDMLQIDLSPLNTKIRINHQSTLQSYLRKASRGRKREKLFWTPATLSIEFNLRLDSPTCNNPTSDKSQRLLIGPIDPN